MIAEPRLLVLKIGGSVLSDKRGPSGGPAVDDSAMAGFARQVAHLAALRPGRVVLVTGGGALCHPVGLRIKADRTDPYAAVALTEPAFAMRWAWTRLLRERGVPAVPLQVTSMLREGPDGEAVTETGALRALLAGGALPVLSSDCVPTATGVRILSSDEVPGVVLGDDPATTRVVALTDVPGIHTGLAPGSPVLDHVDPFDLAAAARHFWPTGEWDATGAMEGKVEALAEHARRGAECVITEGDPHGPDLAHLFAPTDAWPAGVPRTLISRRLSAAHARGGPAAVSEDAP